METEIENNLIKKSLSIGILADYINPTRGGHARNVYYLAKAMERKGHKITVFCLDDPMNREMDLNMVFVKSIRKPFLQYLSASISATKLAKKCENEFDAFFSSSSFGFPYAWVRRKPLLVRIPNTNPRPFGGAAFRKSLWNLRVTGNVYIKILVMMFVKTLTLNKADIVVCNTMETQRAVQKYHFVPVRKLRILHSGCDINFFQSGTGQKIREKYGLNNRKIIVSVFRLGPAKWPDVLIDTMEFVCKERDDIVLMMVGGGVLEDSLRSMIKSRGLSGNIILTGHIPHQELPDYYAVGDIFVDLTPPGVTLAEAMAAGKTFILHCPTHLVHAGSPIEMIEKREIGVILRGGTIEEFAREIMRTVDNNSWLITQGEKAQQFVKEELDWNSLADLTTGYFNEAIESHK